MSRRRAAATAHKFCAGLNDSPRVFGHVLRRAHVNLSATNVARQSGIRLCRELASGEGAHLFDCVEHDRGSDSAIETNYIGAPFVQLRSKGFRRRAKQGVAIDLNRHLRHDRQIAQRTHRSDRLMQLRNIRKRLEHEQINSTFKQRRHLSCKHRFCFIEGRRSVRFNAQPERANGAGYKHAIAGGFAGDLCGPDVDFAQAAFQTIGL